MLYVRTVPAERCGELAPPLLAPRAVPEECVLRPGHSGSHATEGGTRWRIRPAPEPGVEQQRHTADTITDDALDRLYERLERAEAEGDQLAS